MASAQCEMFANQKHTNYATTVANLLYNTWQSGPSSAECDAYWEQTYHLCMSSQGYEYR